VFPTRSRRRTAKDIAYENALLARIIAEVQSDVDRLKSELEEHRPASHVRRSAANV